MKYRMREKRERNEAIRSFRKRNPDITLQEIGQRYGISAQRVHQIITAPITNRKKVQTP